MVAEGSNKCSSSCRATPKYSRVCGTILKKYSPGYRQLPEDPDHPIQRFMLIQETNDTTITACTTWCSDVPTNLWHKKHNSARKRWVFVHGSHVLPMSINGSPCRKFSVMQVNYTRGIAIYKNRTDHGVDNELHTINWQHWPELSVTGYMLHHQFRQKQITCLKKSIMWRRWRTQSLHKLWSPRIKLHFYFSGATFQSFTTIITLQTFYRSMRLRVDYVSHSKNKYTPQSTCTLNMELELVSTNAVGASITMTLKILKIIILTIKLPIILF